MNKKNLGWPVPAANPAKLESELAVLAPLAGEAEPANRDTNGRFLTGNNGGGRPKGSRNRLTDVFLSSIADDFAEHGADVIAQVRQDDPAAYLKIIGSFVPRDLVLQRESEPVSDLASLTFTELMDLVEQAERRRVAREALRCAERGY